MLKRAQNGISIAVQIIILIAAMFILRALEEKLNIRFPRPAGYNPNSDRVGCGVSSEWSKDYEPNS